MISATEKIEFINTLQGQAITSLSFDLVALNGQVLPDWLTAAFAPEFKKEFPRILNMMEKQLKSTAEAELALLISTVEADLVSLKQRLKDLKRNGGNP